MFEKFGELNSFGEINELAENLFNEGDTESLKAMAKENGIQNEFVQMYLQGDIPVLCDPLTAAMLVINALAASDYVLIPVQADYLAAEDMTELVGTVQQIKRQINPKLKIGGVFLTMANETNFRRDTVRAVKENFGKHLPVLQTVIPATVRLAEVSTADKSIFKHEPKGQAAAAYGGLVKEVLAIGEKQRGRSAQCR